MRIVVDGRMLSWTGIGRYTLSLLEGLEAIDQTNRYVVLVHRRDWSTWTPRSTNFTRVECNIEPYSLAEQTKLPGVLGRLAPDVVHLLTPNAAAAYTGRKVVTVHDLTLLDHDTSRGSLRRRVSTKLKRIPFRLIFLRQIATATRVITVTDYVKQQLVGRFRIDPARVSTTWLAADADHLTEAEEECLPEVGALATALLYVGNYYPYKNVRTLIEALGLVADAHPDLKLLLVGRMDEFKDELLALAESLGLSDRVVMPGFVTDRQLTWLYRNCSIFVNPSVSEGFGLQGLEAMSEGLPVIAARATCLPEVYGDAAMYFDPLSAADLSRRIVDLLQQPGLSAELSAKGRERIRMFSWRRTAEATHQLYLEAGADRFGPQRTPAAPHTTGAGVPRL